MGKKKKAQFAKNNVGKYAFVGGLEKQTRQKEKRSFEESKRFSGKCCVERHGGFFFGGGGIVSFLSILVAARASWHIPALEVDLDPE